MKESTLAAQTAQSESATSYRWFILLIAWICLLMTFVVRLAWSNVAVTVGSTLNIPVIALGIFVTAFYIGYVASNALGGFLSDKLGPRKMLACSFIPLGLATFAFSYTNSITTGFIIQLLMGLFAGSVYATCVKVVMVWFDKSERGRAMGLLTTATSLGVVVVNIVVPPALSSFGWQSVYYTLGIVAVVIGIISFLVIKDSSNISGATSIASEKFGLSTLFKNKSLIILAIVGFCAMWGTWGFAFWANALMIKEHSFTPVQAGSVTAMFGIGAVIAKPTIGYLSDLLGGKKKVLLIICYACFAVMLFVFSNMTNLTHFRIVAPLLGVFAFSYTPLMAAMIAENAGVKNAAAATGLTNAIWQIGSIIVPVAIGVVFQSTGSFLWVFSTLAVGPVLATLLISFIKE